MERERTMILPRKAFLIGEFILLFLAVPVILRVFLPGRFLLPLLWPAALLCLAWLWQRRGLKAAELWTFSGQGRNVARVVGRFAIAALIIGALVALFAPESLFALVRARPALWMMIMLLYPLLSAYPQGIVYRLFFFRRYGELFRTQSAMVFAGAAAFAALHVVFGNLPAMGLSFAGGLIFARTYARTKSLPVSWLEHALYGCFLFTIGLGSYLYHGR